MPPALPDSHCLALGVSAEIQKMEEGKASLCSSTGTHSVAYLGTCRVFRCWEALDCRVKPRALIFTTDTSECQLIPHACILGLACVWMSPHCIWMTLTHWLLLSVGIIRSQHRHNEDLHRKNSIPLLLFGSRSWEPLLPAWGWEEKLRSVQKAERGY